MELEILKDVFFVGEEQAINDFVATLKPRCIKATTETAEENGHTVRLLFNSEDDSYISPYMHKYKKCAHCGRIEPADSFRTVAISPSQQRRVPMGGQGRRHRTVTEETVCGRCVRDTIPMDEPIPEDLYLVQDSVNPATYLYTDNQYTKWYLGTDNARHFFTVLNGGPCVQLAVVTDNGAEYAGNDELIQFAAQELTTDVFIDRRHPDLFMHFLTSEVEHSGDFEKCPDCGRVWLTSQHAVSDGHCAVCGDVRIYPYHCWRGRLDFKRAEGEEDNKLFFGTEVETEGDSGNRRLVAPYQDLWHLEHDGSLGSGSFEMISQPMTWSFMKSAKARIEAMFKALNENGQKSHNAPSGNCGLHIHVSRNAFVSPEAIRRAVIIVNGFRRNMELFARRSATRYCQYSGRMDWSNGRMRVNADTYNSIDTCGHCVAVNLANHGSDKNTVEFRIFRGTLNPSTCFATVEFVKNIVEVANDLDKKQIKFSDLVYGEFVPDYVRERTERYGAHFDMDAVIDFSFATVQSAWEAFSAGNHDGFDRLIRAALEYTVNNPDSEVSDEELQNLSELFAQSVHRAEAEQQSEDGENEAEASSQPSDAEDNADQDSSDNSALADASEETHNILPSTVADAMDMMEETAD